MKWSRSMKVSATSVPRKRNAAARWIHGAAPVHHPGRGAGRRSHAAARKSPPVSASTSG
jgi:hypothetical protein